MRNAGVGGDALPQAHDGLLDRLALVAEGGDADHLVGGRGDHVGHDAEKLAQNKLAATDRLGQ